LLPALDHTIAVPVKQNPEPYLLQYLLEF